MYRFNKAEHIHTLNAQPMIGTSTVTGRIAKGGLTWWASGLACEQYGWLNPKKVSDEERLAKAQAFRLESADWEPKKWLSHGDKAYKAHMMKLDKSAKDGTDLHAELEKFVKYKMSGNSFGSPDTSLFDPQITPFIHWANANVKRFLWSEMHCYSEEHFVGGISDVGAELNDGRYIIIDFKSAKEVYPSHFIQIAGYDIEISENGGFDSEGNKTFTLDKPISAYAVVPFGAKVVEPVLAENVTELKNTFLHVLELHKFLLQYEEKDY